MNVFSSSTVFHIIIPPQTIFFGGGGGIYIEITLSIGQSKHLNLWSLLGFFCMKVVANLIIGVMVIVDICKLTSSQYAVSERLSICQSVQITC